MKSLPVDDNLAQTNNVTLNRGLDFPTLKFAINDVPGSCTSLRQPNQQRRYTTQKPDRKGVTERRAFFHQDATLDTGRKLRAYYINIEALTCQSEVRINQVLHQQTG